MRSTAARPAATDTFTAALRSARSTASPDLLICSVSSEDARWLGIDARCSAGEKRGIPRALWGDNLPSFKDIARSGRRIAPGRDRTVRGCDLAVRGCVLVARGCDLLARGRFLLARSRVFIGVDRVRFLCSRVFQLPGGDLAQSGCDCARGTRKLAYQDAIARFHFAIARKEIAIARKDFVLHRSQAVGAIAGGLLPSTRRRTDTSPPSSDQSPMVARVGSNVSCRHRGARRGTARWRTRTSSDGFTRVVMRWRSRKPATEQRL